MAPGARVSRRAKPRIEPFPQGLEQRGLLENYGDLPVWNNYRNMLAPVLTRHGATPDMMPQIFPDFAIDPMKLYLDR